MALNPHQQEAVDTLDGPLLLLAGAGSGKTRVIIHRIANMIRHGIRPENILAVTFTNKAAKEMKERVAELLSHEQAQKVTISTFHAFCLNVLRKYIQHLGYGRRFSIATEGYQKGLAREIASELKLVGEGCDPYLWLSKISLAKANLQEPEDMANQDFPKAEDAAKVYRRYQTRLKQMDLLDFDDLLTLTVKLWQTEPDILEAYQNTYTHLMVDEYQDTNYVQLRLMVLLAGKNANISVVGDDDQSIYGWRGANLGNILDFERFFPGAKTIRLEQNYRSTNTILKTANALIAKNLNRKAKNLWSQQGEGEKVIAVRCEDERAEAEFVADFLHDRVQDRRWNQFAVLFRSGHQSRILEEVLRSKRVPYVLVGTNSFFQRKEILDAVSFLRIIANPKDDLSLKQVINVPPRGAGDVTIDTLNNLAKITRIPLAELLNNPDFLAKIPAETANNLTRFSEVIGKAQKAFAIPGELCEKTKRLLDDIGYINGLVKMYKPREDALKRKDNVLEFLTTLAEFDEANNNRATIQDYLEQFDLQDANDRRRDSMKNQGEAVTLMTVHASKGLEFPTVLVVGMEQGLFPHQTAIDEGNLEEERRLCYVAVTRARETLVLSYAERRRIANKVVLKRPSKFLDEMPQELVDFSTPKKVIKPPTQEEMSDFFAQLRKQFES
ncbi:MAG: UvrD-helicase domain-containing protein [Lentisphaerae bacterium]|jgi:DNA helicase-2/ATP-dependent DNA helicase PcrA|nr:UvrD-helicase domain-containing protein [Lentisphaerota bacterium]